MTVYAQRRKRLLSLAQGKQVVALTPANKFWLTDFWGAGAAIVLPERTVVITSPLEADRVRETGKEVEVVVARGSNDVQRALVKQLDKGKVMVDDGSGLQLKPRAVSRPSTFVEARRVKDQEEIQRIRRASKGLDEIFAGIIGFLRHGASEWKVASEVMRLATERRLTPIQDGGALSPVIIASGPNGALPHSELSPRMMKKGNMVVADIFFRFDGYYSDCTRTFAVESSSPEARKNYSSVKDAQEAALEIAKEGEMCGEVNKAAVDVLRENGIDKYLNHSIGHGVGIDIHELPRISKGEKVRLARNDVVTDEPGVYIRGKYGIRIEDTLVIGKKPEVLTKFTKDFVTCG